MRGRIIQLANGKFDDRSPVLKFSQDKVELEVLEGQKAYGEFTIQSVNGVPIKGLVYTSGPRMKCLTPQFKGEEAVIRYEFHSEGLNEGDIQKGDFYIICNQGEYNLSFVVSISKPYAKASTGRIRNLTEFTILAEENWDEAQRIFMSPVFRNLLDDSKKREEIYYDSLIKAGNSGIEMEEFLTACGRKEKVTFSIKEEQKFFADMTETMQEIIEIKQERWGYLEIRVDSDSEFLVPKKSVVTTDDFVGSICNFEYLIDEEKMHVGKNYGRLTFHNMEQTKTVEICATRDSLEIKKDRTSLEVQKCRAKITEYYIDYRLKKIVTGEWASKTIEVLKHLQALEPENIWYGLMQAQCYLVNRQKQEALWILEDYKKNRKDDMTAEHGYYLYLCTLAEREPAYVNKLAAQIEKIYRENQENKQNRILFWVLLFVKEEYCEDDSKRLKAIEQRVIEGERSPFLYMEAYYLMWLNPYYLVKLDDFEIRVLYWAAKKNALSRDLAIQIMSLASSKRFFDPILYRLLCLSYERYRGNDMVMTVCSYLIKTQKFGREFFYWYDRGIELNLRITGLNEAFLLSTDMSNRELLPKVIQMYFQYSSTLPYQKKAELFSNIIQNKDIQPEVYQNYRKNLEHFAADQIQSGHIDGNLAVIYRDMIDQGLLNREMAHALPQILFSEKVFCDCGDAVRIYVIHPEMKEVQTVSVSGQEAYVNIYTSNAVIIVEDRYGRRYATLGDHMEIEKLLNPGSYLKKCLEYVPDDIRYLLHHFSGKDNYQISLPEEKEYLCTLMDSEEIADRYKAVLCPGIIRLYDEYDDETNTEKYLKMADFGLLDRKERCFLVELLIDKRMYDEAYELIREYGLEQMDPVRMVALCSYQIENFAYELDDFLLAMCELVFRSRKYNDVILTYLSRFYGGFTKNLAEVWEKCREFEVDTKDLEERLVVQMLYTTDFPEHLQEIYDSFAENGGKKLIRTAYLNYFSYVYFVKEQIVDSEIFTEIRERLDDELELSDVCKLALLKHYSEDKQCCMKEEELIDHLLSLFIEQEMYFEFYKKFTVRMVEKYQLTDKIILEYRTDPGKRVLLHYATSDDPENYKTEDMVNMFGGIFAKQFIIFFGDRVQYYITEESENKSEVVISSELVNSDVYGEYHASRYDLLNEILLNITLKDTRLIEEKMKDYDRKSKMIQEEFKIL